jgi:hypothetical protein
MAALNDRPRPGKEPTITAEAKAWVVNLACRKAKELGYRTHHLGWNVKHFHEHIREQHGFRWGYTWTKTQLHTAGLVERAARRRKRPRKPCEGMMVHQDGGRFAWLSDFSLELNARPIAHLP